jgi:hypothetical protein
MSEIIQQEQVEYTNTSSETIFKRWHRTGFISIGYWAKANRITIEIGALDDNGILRNATKCFLEAPKFLAYLRAEITDNLFHVYPKYEEPGKNGGFVSFGSRKTREHGDVSRVFKSTYWLSGKEVDKSARAFKCGHFKGTPNAQGAVNPDYQQPISQNSMKISLEVLAEMYEAVSTACLIKNMMHHINGGDKANG